MGGYAPRVLAQGAEIRGYRIERLLGRGGMGEVYEAVQLELGRRVAFKVLHSGLVDDESFRKRFRREGRLQATLEHPHVVTVYEAGEIDEGLFLAMRLIDGVTLKELIAGGELDVGRALRILMPVADALDAAHASGLVHRDVKPQNILIAAGDNPFLADFGLIWGRDQTAFTRADQVVGTIDYAAPEQMRGETVGAASDVYALCGVMYECLTGSVPYPLPTNAAVLYAHMSEQPPRVSALRDDLPAGLDAVIAGGMAKDPADRPTRATELVAAAAAEVGDGPPAATPPPAGRLGGEAPRAATTRTASRPRRAPVALAGLAGLAALGVLAFLGGRALGGGEPPKLMTSVTGEALALRAPGSWTASSADERPLIPGLSLSDAIGAAPARRDASGVAAGMTAAGGASLLPAALADRAVGGLPKPEPVTLGELEALRYRDLPLRGFDRDLTLYASPSSSGVATVACYSPAETGGFEATCDSIAQTLELTRGRPLPLAASPQSEAALARAVDGLRRKRKAGRRRLARAANGDAQAAAAAGLAAAYAAADARLGRLEAGPLLAGEVTATRSALAAAAAAYRAMAGAARSADAAGFSAAERTVRTEEARLRDALARLER